MTAHHRKKRYKRFPKASLVTNGSEQGGQTYANSSWSVNQPKPTKEEILELIQIFEKLSIKVKLKSTLNRPIK